MKKLATLFLTAGMLFGAATGASAVDFKAHGEWIFGFGAVDTAYYGQNGQDTFAATQRVRLQIDAIASESLSGSVFFEIGDQTWGNNDSGGALGTDGQVIEVRRAYIDWIVPNTALSLRMGLQYFGNPAVAGGSAIFAFDGAGISANYKINDMVGLSAAWIRPYNDNFEEAPTGGDSSNYLDNTDLFLLSVPVKGSNWSATPWIMGGVMGNNSRPNKLTARWGLAPRGASFNSSNLSHEPAYTTLLWVGLPMSFTYDAFNFELDLNYGSVSYGGTYTFNGERIDQQRQGWLIKALAEYKMDWGTPGIFAWYGSGDDGNIHDGSERLPVLSPSGTFTSFFGDDPWSFTTGNWGGNVGFDQSLGYDGTWGIGAQVKNFSFVEKLSHTFRITYWGGTNHTDNAKHIGGTTTALGSANANYGTFYLTTADYMVEFNLDSTYKIYDNLTAMVQLGYAINGIDKDTWGHDERRDGYKAGVVLRYAF